MNENNIYVGFIGGGNMSTAIVRGLIKTGAYDPSKIWVSGPNIQNLKHWQEMGTNVTVHNSEVFTKCDIVILGVKPGKLHDSIAGCLNGIGCAPTVAKNKIIVSMLTGVNMDQIKKALQHLYSYANMKLVRIMPNTPMTVGKGICLYTKENNVDPKLMNVLLKLLEASSVCQEVPEEMIPSLASLTACGPAFIYIVIEALADGAVKQGVPRDLALRFASQMVIGSGHMVLETGKHPGLLKDEVCSPGGSTICGVTALENGKLRATLINAIEAATAKNKSFD